MNKLIAILIIFLSSSTACYSWSDETLEQDRTIVIEKENLSDALGEVAGEIKREFISEIKSEIEGSEDGEKTIRFEGDGEGMSAGETLIAFTAIMMSLGMPILILLLVLIYSHRRRKQKLELVKTFLDANRDVPENILTEFDGDSNTHLSSGIKIVGLGLGIILAVYLLTGSYELAALGLIPLFIGLSRLILWKLEDSKVNEGA